MIFSGYLRASACAARGTVTRWARVQGNVWQTELGRVFRIVLGGVGFDEFGFALATWYSRSWSTGESKEAARLRASQSASQSPLIRDSILDSNRDIRVRGLGCRSRRSGCRSQLLRPEAMQPTNQ